MERAAAVFLLVTALGTASAEEGRAQSATARQHRFACVCEMCNRRPLDVCACQNANHMRTQLGLVVERLGADEVAIDREMVQKYGPSVLSPVAEAKTDREIPWLGPLILGALGVGVVWRIARASRRRRRS